MTAETRNVSGIDSLVADVCIVGSGPAGMTIARELARSHLRIFILESGDQTPSTSASELNQGAVDSPQGYPAEVLEDGRRRQWGGSANLWNHEPRDQKNKFIRCVPLDTVDFEKRDWLPHSGWPFSRSELVPYYERAQRAFGIGKFDYSSAGWAGDTSQGKPLETNGLTSSVSQFALPKAFLKDATEELKSAPNIRFFLRTHLISLERDSLTHQIVAASVADSEGRPFRIEAGVFVLAAGGLENPRILLLNQVGQEGGLGNQHDRVGRCFMDHPSITLGTLTPGSLSFFDDASFYDQHTVDGRQVMGKLHLRQEVIRREKLLNLYAVLVPRFRNLHCNIPLIIKELLIKGPQFLSRHKPELRGCVTQNQHHEPSLSIRQRLLEGYFSECFCGWSKLKHKARRFGEFGVRALVELSPDPANRVMLGEDRDRLGQRKLKVVWRWNEADLASIRRTQSLFASEFAAAGIGKFVPTPEAGADFPRAFYSTHHFMGTTRMHHDPRQGVVDADCKVHGLANLFVAGSSVFPTGGCANPTLTLVALAIRLAAHLKTRATVASIQTGNHPEPQDVPQERNPLAELAMRLL